MLVFTFSLAIGAITLAVHLDGNMELDNNAVSSATTTDGADWDQVYTSVTADPNTTGPDDTCLALGAIECAWTHDATGQTIFTQGGSKDDLDISNWRHTSGSVPDKDEISDAYAALFEDGGEQILYFGANRDANNGAADFGFWFLQSETQANTSTGTFTDANRRPRRAHGGRHPPAGHIHAGRHGRQHPRLRVGSRQRDDQWRAAGPGCHAR